MMDWLEVHRGDAPLIVSFPHTGTELPTAVAARLISPWLARKDADWWIERLYDFAPGLGATTVRTAISRTVIDVNRDPSGASLYPGQATTGLCPTTTFDGEPLYRAGEPDAAEIARRRAAYFEPYHAALAGEVERLRAIHPKVVLYEAHAIRSAIPRLFEGELPNFNVGTNSGASCDPALTAAVEAACDASPFGRVTDGRFKGGWTTRHYGRPGDGVHAIQMELACRGYMDEPEGLATPLTWPTPYEDARAAPMRAALTNVLQACLEFARC
ncbi:N-formylglutamate deformylase [Phenylobacterium sp.]|uniref:N-formylglutamate deformylase n=1 Tax=Phenylobacterium sp. TaxID=1871053 RepID=UPI0025DA7A69|nr:N-formylglutamate deformylase [Phenylobacterium sp.]MBX3484687.1 N-formylglutamate deformylase [Phenylobacterium sp.]MCW5760256.1 N-formylglutamate deformylase [Phenylobacterium sp.]